MPTGCQPNSILGGGGGFSPGGSGGGGGGGGGITAVQGGTCITVATIADVATVSAVVPCIQTPWLQGINAGGFNLSNVGTVATVNETVFGGQFIVGANIAAAPSIFVNTAGSGSVGIGNSTPAYELDVTGDARATGCFFIGTTSPPVSLCNDGAGGLLVNGVPAVAVSPGAPVRSVQFNAAGAFGGSGNLLWTAANALQVTGTVATVSETVFGGSFIVGANAAAAPSIYVDTAGSGSVGIGNATPQYELDVTGDVRASGCFFIGAAAPLVSLCNSGGNLLVNGQPVGGGVPAPPNLSVQFNNAGAFGGSANCTFNSATNLFTTLFAQFQSLICADANDATVLNASQLNWRTNNLARWSWQKFGNETGGNAGSDMLLVSFADDGATSRNVFLLQRATGFVGIGNALLFPPQFPLDVAGDMNIATGSVYRIGGVPLAFPGTPAAPLASVQFNAAGAFGGSANLAWNNGAQALLVNGTVESVSATVTGGTFYVTSATTAAPAIYVDTAAADSVGIGTATPAYELDVVGDVHTSGCVLIGPVANLVSLCNDGSGNLLVNGVPAVAVTPAAPVNSVQFNNNGAFGGSANLIWNNARAELTISSPNITQNLFFVNTQPDLSVGSTQQLVFQVNAFNAVTPAGSLQVGITDVGSVTCDLVLQPDGGGTAGTVVQFRNASTGGFALNVFGDLNIQGSPAPVYRINGTPLSFPGIPAAPANSVQWNNAGAFGGSANLTWNNTNGWLGVGNNATTPPAVNNPGNSPIHLIVGPGAAGNAIGNVVIGSFNDGTIGNTIIGSLQFANYAISVPDKRAGTIWAARDATSGGASLIFSTRPNDATNPPQRMLINPAGLVGINANTPDQQLTVSNTTSPGTIMHFGLGGYIGYDGTSGACMSVNATNNAGVWTSTSNNGSATVACSNSGGNPLVQFFVDSPGSGNTFTPTQRAVITLAGNMGIGNQPLGSNVPDANTAARVALMIGTPNVGAQIGGLHLIGNVNTTTGVVGTLSFANYNLVQAEKRIGIIQGSCDGATNSGNLQFWTMNAGALAEWMRILSTGAIGMGTTNPQGSLHISRSAPGGLGANLFLDNSGGGAGATTAVAFGNSGFGVAGQVCARIVGSDNGDFSDNIIFSTKNPGAQNNPQGERMRITSGGNVGINKANPGSRLAIVGLPTSNTGLTAGDIWVDPAAGNALKIV